MRLFQEVSLKDTIQKIKEDPKTIFYYIQGHVNWFLYGWIIKRYFNRVNKCSTCFHNNECVKCGCPFNQLATSTKPCKK